MLALTEEKVQKTGLPYLQSLKQGCHVNKVENRTAIFTKLKTGLPHKLNLKLGCHNNKVETEAPALNEEKEKVKDKSWPRRKKTK